MNRFNRLAWVRSFASVALAASAGLLAIQADASAATIDSPTPSVYVGGNSVTNVVDGASIANLNAMQSAQVNISGGNVSWVWLNGQSSANVTGGDISWIMANDESHVTISGAQDISWLLLHGPSTSAQILAQDVQYSRGHVSGTWNGGGAFSFWAVDGDQLMSGSGGVFDLGYTLTSTGITLFTTSVPEPGTWAMMGLGLLAVGAVARASKARQA